jgi:hypothetical protein
MHKCFISFNTEDFTCKKYIQENLEIDFIVYPESFFDQAFNKRENPISKNTKVRP